MFDLLEKVLPIPEFPGLYYLICVAMFVRGCHLIAEWYWARERARGPEYWQALLDSEFKHLCVNCRLPIISAEGVWVDSSGGDVCCADVFTESNTDGTHQK